MQTYIQSVNREATILDTLVKDAVLGEHGITRQAYSQLQNHMTVNSDTGDKLLKRVLQSDYQRKTAAYDIFRRRRMKGFKVGTAAWKEARDETEAAWKTIDADEFALLRRHRGQDL